MKINKIHIDNFGVLQNYDRDFNKNLTVILADNGKGKSTLALFILAMFFGLEDIGHAKKIFYERQRFLPWQGGKYGGYLDFEAKGKNYRIARFFGEKKGDEFTLFDMDERCKIETENGTELGEKILGVDRETYGRTAFITLEDTYLPVMTSAILSCLTNVLQDNDVANFSSAKSMLEKKIEKLLGKTGRSGEIYKLQQDIDSKKQDLRQIQVAEKKYEDLLLQIKSNEEQQNELQSTRKLLEEQFALSEKWSKKLHYESLKNGVEEAIKEIDAVMNFFGGQIVSNEVLNDAEKMQADYEMHRTKWQTLDLKPCEKAEYEALEKSFLGNVPESKQLDTILEQEELREKLEKEATARNLSCNEAKRFEELNCKYSGLTGKMVNDCYTQQERLEVLESEICELQKKRDSLDEEIAQKTAQMTISPLRLLAFTFSGLCCISFVMLFIFHLLVLATIFGTIGLSLAVFGFIKKERAISLVGLQEQIVKLEEQINKKQQEINIIKKECEEFVSKWGADSNLFNRALANIASDVKELEGLFCKKTLYDSWYNKLETTPETLQNIVLDFLSLYGQNTTENATRFITNMKENLVKLQNYNNRLDEAQIHKEAFLDIETRLEKFTSSYATNKTEPLHLQIKCCRQKRIDYDYYKQAEQEAKNKLQAFEEVNDMDAIEQASKPDKSMEEIKTQLETLQIRNQEINRNLAMNNQDADILIASIEKKQDTQVFIDNKTEELFAKTKEHDILKKTLQLLQNANDNLQNSYMPKMKKSFERYLNILGCDLRLEMEKDINVKLYVDNIDHEAKYLSSGYKDLINICAKFSLFDSIYTQDLPPIILDDPFVNLDKDKVQNAIKLVQNISQNKQVIYFVCHDSRAINLI